MLETDDINELINTIINCDIKSSAKYFVLPHNDSITNEIRTHLDKLNEEKITEIKNFLNHILNVCYGYKLFDEPHNEDDILIQNLNKDEIFAIKETVIYFIGRLKILPDVDILKKAYFLDDNKYIKLNLALSSLSTFDEEIELDFVSKVEPGNEYDKMLRSWTMAFVTDSPNPYAYKDYPDDDWTKAKMPLLIRLAINEDDHPKFNKAMAFRLMDLLIIYLFLDNRGDTLDELEKDVIEKVNINYYEFSPKKRVILAKYKDLILK